MKYSAIASIVHQHIFEQFYIQCYLMFNCSMTIDQHHHPFLSIVTNPYWSKCENNYHVNKQKIRDNLDKNQNFISILFAPSNCQRKYRSAMSLLWKRTIIDIVWISCRQKIIDCSALWQSWHASMIFSHFIIVQLDWSIVSCASPYEIERRRTNRR